ncbi:MAG: hypothetical protein JWO80_3445 [Bryobacterales bacterium]|nr:hypothetical protein [Bryobacterales bacterium]
MSPAPTLEAEAVFLNIPYDQKFERLYVAYIAGLSALGLVPRVTLGLPTGDRRLNRILSLIASCRYSIHDLSRVELDRTALALLASICLLSWGSLLPGPN